MKDIVEHLPEIIESASASNLGIVALMLIIFSALSWGFFRRSSEKWKLTSLGMLLIGCLLFGYVAIDASRALSVSNGSTTKNLASSLTHWVSKAEAARQAKTISSSSPLPTELVNSRNEFEKNWRNSSLSERKTLDAELAFKGLSYTNRLYRVVENDSSIKPNATYWADESIRFFEETQDAVHLTEALIVKAALYLDISQLGHNDKKQFEEMAREGDAVMTSTSN